ncbi:PorT family protein [Bacteroidales bacterium OttesenSCG-928-L03]|nr:PorT family protein [Bacteroidales bacterium OttesenSCG-928-L03]
MNRVSTCLLVLLLGLSVPAFSQVKFGVKGGLNVSEVSGYDKFYKSLNGIFGESSTGLNEKSKSGYHLGVMMQADIPATDFFIQPELLFSNQGSKLEMSVNLGAVGLDKITTTRADNLNYLQLPIYAGYRIDLGTGLELILAAGPYFSYGVYASNDEFKKNGGLVKLDRFDMGLSFMGGIQLNDKMQITVGYDWGVKNIADSDKWDSGESNIKLPSIRNRNLKLSVGYFF